MPKSLDLHTVRDIAAEVAREQKQPLEVMGVRAGDGDYDEILLSVNGCDAEPCRVSLQGSRDRSLEQVRTAIAVTLRQHLASRK